jgi:hypothetical protein
MPMTVNESEGKGKKDNKKEEGEWAAREMVLYSVGVEIDHGPTLNSIHTITQGEQSKRKRGKDKGK